MTTEPKPETVLRERPEAQRRRIATTPLVDDLVFAVQRHLNSLYDRRFTYGDALDWIVRDIEWCEPDKPAYGQWSPVFAQIVKQVLRSNPRVS